jgi:hypothetical protein
MVGVSAQTGRAKTHVIASRKHVTRSVMVLTKPKGANTAPAVRSCSNLQPFSVMPGVLMDLNFQELHKTGIGVGVWWQLVEQ